MPKGAFNTSFHLGVCMVAMVLRRPNTWHRNLQALGRQKERVRIFPDPPIPVIFFDLFFLFSDFPPCFVRFCFLFQGYTGFAKSKTFAFFGVSLVFFQTSKGWSVRVSAPKSQRFLRLRCTSRTTEIAAISQTRESYAI